jgi:hypothetical protein
MENYVKKITGTNFKGKNFVHPLRAVSVIYGDDNSVGKTAIAEAIRVGLLGYSPRHGKKPSATFGFAGSKTGAKEMSVVLEVGGSIIERKFELIKGSVKASGFEGVIVPPVLLDVQEWLTLSGPKKTEYVFNRMDLSAAGFTTDKITARLKKDVKVETPDEESERIIGEMLDAVADLAEFRDHEKQTGQQWIEAIRNHFDATLNKAKTVVEQMEGAIGAGTQLQAQDGLNVVENVTEELQKARTTLQTSLTALQTLTRLQEEHTTKSQRKARLETELQGKTDQSEAVVKANAEVEERAKALMKYQSDTIKLVQQHTTALSAAATMKSQGEAVKRDIAAAEAKLDEDLKRESCPYCGSKGKGWKAALKKSITDQIDKLKSELAGYQDKQKLEEEVRDAFAFDVEQSKKKDKEHADARHNLELDRRNLSSLIGAQNAYATNKARLEEIGDIGQPISQDKIQDAQRDVVRARQTVEGLEEKERRQIAANQDNLRQEQARQNHTAKKIEIEIYSLAVKTIKALQSEMMDAAFGGFMDKMNVIADGIFPKGKLVFHDGQIGYWEGASFAALEYFGGTEEMLAFAGLSLTLAAEAKFKIVIMDELARIKKPRKIALIQRMRQLVRDGVIDQFIGIDPDGDNYQDFNGCDDVALIDLK